MNLFSQGPLPEQRTPSPAHSPCPPPPVPVRHVQEEGAAGGAKLEAEKPLELANEHVLVGGAQAAELLHQLGVQVHVHPLHGAGAPFARASPATYTRPRAARKPPLPPPQSCMGGGGASERVVRRARRRRDRHHVS